MSASDRREAQISGYIPDVSGPATLDFQRVQPGQRQRGQAMALLQVVSVETALHRAAMGKQNSTAHALKQLIHGLSQTFSGGQQLRDQMVDDDGIGFDRPGAVNEGLPFGLPVAATLCDV